MKLDLKSFYFSNFNIDNLIYETPPKNLNKTDNNNFDINKFQNNSASLNDKSKDKTTYSNIEKKIEEKIKKLKEELKQDEEKKYKYIIKYDKLLKNYYLEVVDPNTKKVVKTIPPEFLLKVERHLKKFLDLIEKLEYLNDLKQNFNNQKIDKLLHEIKTISKDIGLPEDDFKNLLSEYTESYFA